MKPIAPLHHVVGLRRTTMFKKLLRKLKLGRGAAAVIDTVASQALDKATGGLASDVEALVKKRKAK